MFYFTLCVLFYSLGTFNSWELGWDLGTSSNCESWESSVELMTTICGLPSTGGGPSPEDRSTSTDSSGTSQDTRYTGYQTSPVFKPKVLSSGSIDLFSSSSDSSVGFTDQSNDHCYSLPKRKLEDPTQPQPKRMKVENPSSTAETSGGEEVSRITERMRRNEKLQEIVDLTEEESTSTSDREAVKETVDLTREHSTSMGTHTTTTDYRQAVQESSPTPLRRR